jgi:hypothetical protein
MVEAYELSLMNKILRHVHLTALWHSYDDDEQCDKVGRWHVKLSHCLIGRAIDLNIKHKM